MVVIGAKVQEYHRSSCEGRWRRSPQGRFPTCLPGTQSPEKTPFAEAQSPPRF